MERDEIIISGTGCALVDFLYADIRFDSPQFKKYSSLTPGDGGLSPGKLVFTGELEEFAGTGYDIILNEITGDQEPETSNLGGNGIVPLIHVSQLLTEPCFKVKFYGGTGSDNTAIIIYDILKQTPLDTTNFKIICGKPTPFTHVFSDPSYNNGQGERCFVNNIGAAWDYLPEYLESNFFSSDIVLFGGTALVPNIHDNLTDLLIKAKRNNCITVVNTVFDFRNEKMNPGKPWPMGDTAESLKLIDLLVMGKEEALRISGKYNLDDAAKYFIACKSKSFIITNGADDFYAYSENGIFTDTGLLKLPVSGKVKNDILTSPLIKGDTTGCGDNFVGGAIAAMSWQMRKEQTFRIDFRDVISWAVASGGFACYYFGGTYIETRRGEKLQKIKEIRDLYLEQTSLLELT